MTLTEWLRAQLDADEAAARSAWQPNFRWYSEDKGVVTVWDEDDQEYARWRPANTRADAEHIVSWDPTRALAEVKAKRRVLDEIVPRIDEMDSLIESEWGNGLGPVGESEPLIKLLAQPYAGRDGWQPEWATPPD